MMKKNILAKIKKILLTILLLLMILFIPTRVLAPIIHDSIKINSNTIIEERLINENIIALKDSLYKNRNEVFALAQPIIEIYLKRNNYNDNFPNMDSLSYAITCIFVSESSNYLGQSARSTLWIRHNNPFGITNGRGKTYKSWEMINNERVVMNRTFATYSSFSEAIDSLMVNCLLKDSYTLTSNSSSVKEFLYNLYKNNYMTNKHWPSFAYNDIYLNYIQN